MKTKLHCNLVMAAFLLLSATLFAQVPQKMSYQAVVRNASGNLVSNSTVGMRISILQGSATGSVVYSETQNPVTNSNGLASFELGMGTVLSGTFSTIDWGNSGPFFVKTETDPAGGSNYSIVGTSEFLSVPYALYSLNPGPAGPAGPPGPAGPTGSVGATGPQGPSGVVSTGMTSGAMIAPTGTLAFISPTISVVITSSTEKVIWWVSGALGSSLVGGGTNLSIYPGYILSTSTAAPNPLGGAILGLHCLQNTRQIYSISGTVTGLAPGTYRFGMVGTGANWNSNEYGYVTYMLVN